MVPPFTFCSWPHILSSPFSRDCWVIAGRAKIPQMAHCLPSHVYRMDQQFSKNCCYQPITSRPSKLSQEMLHATTSLMVLPVLVVLKVIFDKNFRRNFWRIFWWSFDKVFDKDFYEYFHEFFEEFFDELFEKIFKWTCFDEFLYELLTIFFGKLFDAFFGDLFDKHFEKPSGELFDKIFGNLFDELFDCLFYEFYDL